MMEQENMPTPVVEPENSSAPSVGRRLREGRERMGLSIEDVVAKIKIAPRQILAMEEDDFQHLPETAFVRGFVRSYARLLHLDEQPLLDALPGAEIVAVKTDTTPVEAPFPTERSARRQNVNLLIAALLVALVIAGFALWQARAPLSAEKPATQNAMVETPLALSDNAEILGSSSVAEAAPSALSETAASAPVPAALPAPAAAQPVVATAPAATAGKAASLRLVFDKESWAEIKDQSGTTLSRQVNAAGSELRVEGAAPFTMVIGHAASVHLYYREKQVDLSSYINASSDVARLTLE